MASTSSFYDKGRSSTAVAVSVPTEFLDEDDKPLLLGKRSYFSRWVILSVCMAIAYATGSAYDFGLYSDDLQSNLGYSEKEITLLASFANAGLYSMILSGLCLEVVGPRYNLLIGGILSSIGYLFLWAIATLIIRSNVVGSVLSLYLGTFGTSFFSVTCTTLVVANFPARDRGKAVGIMKGFLGLGISINSQFYSTFFGDLDYLLGLAIVLPLVAIVGASTVNYIPRQDLEYSKAEAPNHGGRANFWIWFVLIGGTALWVGTATYLDEELTLQQWANDLLFIPTILLTLVGLAWYPFQYGPLKRKASPTTAEEGGEQDESATLLEKPRPQLLQDDGDFTLPQMLSTVEFWLLFCVFAMGAGVCLTLVNNIAGIVDAFGSSEGTAVPLMLFGIFETAGRLSVAVSDVFGSRVARVFLLDAVLVVLFLCCILLAYANIYTLNVAIILVSYCYGFLYADMSAITADLFGVKHFGGNLGFFLFAPIIGSFGFASGVVDLFYTDGCSGSLCYRYVFLTEAVACLLATVLCLFLKLRIMDRFQVTTFAEIFHRRPI